jgi:hypothetical protein
MTELLSREEGRAIIAKPKRGNKYRAVKVTVDGITFDSKREAAYYAELKLREKAGEVSGVELQKPFAILGANGELICTYRADFAFWDNAQDRFRVIDVKGVETKDFKLKKRLMRILKGIDVEVVR